MKILPNLDKIFNDLRQQLHNQIDSKKQPLKLVINRNTHDAYLSLNGVIVEGVIQIDIGSITADNEIEVKINTISPYDWIDTDVFHKKLHVNI